MPIYRTIRGRLSVHKGKVMVATVKTRLFVLTMASVMLIYCVILEKLNIQGFQYDTVDFATNTIFGMVIMLIPDLVIKLGIKG